MANVGPVLWFLRDNAPTSTIGWSAVTAWPTSTAVAAGVLRRQSAAPTVGNERVFACIVAGTTGGSEPTWVITKGAKTTDNTVTWQEVTGQPGVNGNTADSPTWLQNKNTAVTLGLIIFDSVSASLQIVSTAGTTGNGSQPSFSATAGTTTADNTVTWTSLGLASGFAAWAAPFARMQSVFGAGWAAAGNSLFIGDDHSETQASANTILSTGTTALPCMAYSIDHTGAVTLSGATLLAGAAVATSATNALNLRGMIYCYGIAFNCGSGANIAILGLGNSNADQYVYLENCSLALNGTSTSSLSIGQGLSGSQSGTVQLKRTTMAFTAVSQVIGPTSGVKFLWNDTPNAISGTIPTILFSSIALGPIVVLSGVDLSAAGSGKTFVPAMGGPAYFSFVDCKLGASVVVAATPTKRSTTIDLVSSDSAATNYQKQRYLYEGTLLTETVIVRTGGASSGTLVSDKITTTANSLWLFPFVSIPIAQWNATTGTNRVVTLAGIWNAAAVPNNDDIWIEAEYLGSASTPQASFAKNTKVSNLATGSALTADSTSAWDSLVTARANSTAYSLGDVRKVASNPGRIFFCTTAGTSSGSEPGGGGGYSSAVDGGSVTDGSAAFRAGVRFTLTVTLSSPQPGMVGPVYVTVNAAKVSSTFYVDPLIVLS